MERVNRWGQFMSKKLFKEVQAKFNELKIMAPNFNILDLLENLQTKPTLDQILNICSRITVNFFFSKKKAKKSHDLLFEPSQPGNCSGVCCKIDFTDPKNPVWTVECMA